MDYQEFLESKIATTPVKGFRIPVASLSDSLYPHQRDIVRHALWLGCAGIFGKFGVGKTRIQLELMRQIHQFTGGKTLIVCPLGVKQEFTENDGPAMGMQVQYVRTDAEVEAAETPYLLTNYERIREGNIDVNQFMGVTLDEASVLRGYGTKTYQTFLPLFADIPYRFVCTATPSPNRDKELIHYGGFLGIMDTGQALTRFFGRNSEKAGDLQIYPHMEEEFWLWVSSWAIFIEKPSDLGYSDEGYDLPELKVILHRLPVDHSSAGADSWGQNKLFKDTALGLSEAAREKRDSLQVRLDKAMAIIGHGEPDKHWIIWHHLETERAAIQKALPEAKAVYGSLDLEKREELVLGFSRGEYRILATKPSLSGSGCNFQRHCHANIFLGPNYEFNDFIQSIHRTHRYQQKQAVEVHLIYMETEDNVLKTLMEKWKNHDEMTARMVGIIRKHGLTNLHKTEQLTRSMGVERKEVRGESYVAVQNDTVDETGRMEENSIDLILTSIPFSNQYEYTPSYNDFGHNEGDDAFFEQMDFLIPNLLRVLKPGRVAAIHVKDRVLFGNVTGYGMPSVNPFSDKTVAAFKKHGFIFTGRRTIVTDVVRENNQTYRLGWSEVCKDGTKMGCGMNEYLLLFRKLPSDRSKSYADVPVSRSKEEYTRRQWQIDASGFWRSSGDRLLTPEDLAGKDIQQILHWYRSHSLQDVYDYRFHVEAGRELEKQGRMPATFMLFAPSSPDASVWTDITRMNTLNSRQSQKREQNHVCPLQLDIIERGIEMYTNPGEVVYDPFGGLFSVPYVAVKMGRKGRAVELNPDYFRSGVGYMREIEYKKTVPTLFDLTAYERAEAS